MNKPWSWDEDELSLMRWWSWIACLHFTFLLHLQSPFSLSSSSLFLLSREREEGEKWENGLSWELLQLMIPSSISCIWHVGPRVEWGTAHSPLTACSSGTDGWFSMMSDRLVFSVGWEMDPNTWDLALRPINFILKVNNLSSNILSQYGASFRLRVALLGRKAMYLRFLLCLEACRAHLGASSVVRIQCLGCSELGSLQRSPP